MLAHPNTNFITSSAKYPEMGYSSTTQSCCSIRGSAVDEVKVVLGYLPPRRICDHYNITGDNLYSLVQWYEFVCEDESGAIALLTGEGTEEITVKFVETVQARGCNLMWESSQPTNPRDTVSQVKAFLEFLRDGKISETREMRLFHAACLPSHDRRFGLTAAGRLCLLPFGALKGDAIFFLDGSKVPIVLRPLSDMGGQYENVGECYVHGIMRGGVPYAPPQMIGIR